MKTSIWAIVLCVLGSTAMPAAADDGNDRRGRHEREYRDHDRRGDYGYDSRRRDDRRHERRGHRYDRYDRSYSHRRALARYVAGGRYCDDHRHFRRAHYHVPVREYYRHGYPRDRYQLHHRHNVDATLIVTIPLF